MSLGKGLESLLPQPKRDEAEGPHSGEIKTPIDNTDSPQRDDSTMGLGLSEPARSPMASASGESSEIPKRENASLSAPIPREPSVKEAVFQIEVEKIAPNPFQPRRDFNEDELKELARSIQEFGILQPLIVLKIEKETEDGTDVSYQLIAGERRLKAAKIAGLLNVPCIIRRTDRDVEQLEMATVENLQRSNLNPIETARAYAKLQDEFKMTQREIASRLGKSREAVANAIRLLNLPSDIQEALMKGTISESHGRLLLSAQEDPIFQRALFNDIIKNSMSVRDLKTRIRNDGGGVVRTNNAAKETIPPDLEDESIKERLEEILGTKVKIEKGEKGGRVIISFYSNEELESLMAKLKGDGNLSHLPREPL